MKGREEEGQTVTTTPSRSKRGHHEGSIRQHHTGRWEVRVTLDGKQKSFYADTEKEARAKRRQIVADRDKGAMVVTDHQTTLGKYLTNWLTAKTDLKPLSHKRYTQQVHLHIIPALGRIKLANLTRQQVSEFYEQQRRSGLSAGSIQQMHAILRTALNDAVADEIISRNVAAGIKGMKAKSTEKAHWTAEQAKFFLGAVEGDALEAFYVLALTTGMRRSELLALRWTDIDLQKGIVHVRHTLRWMQSGAFVLDTPKTEAGRRQIPLTEMAINSLTRLQRAEKVKKLAAGAEWSNSAGFIFTTASGNPLRGNHILQRQFEPLCRKLGLPRIRLHDLRHTCASLLYALGYQDVEIAKVLGHSSPSVTREIYIHTDVERLRGASDRLNALLS